MHTPLLPHSLRPAKKFAVYKFITNQAGPMGDRLIQRRVFHVYDIIMMFLKMATGIMTALTRFIMAMVIAIFTLPRMDASPLPGWIERYLLLDMGSQSYHAMIMLHHRHSNPVMTMAIQVWSLATFHRDECRNNRMHFIGRHSLAMGGGETPSVCTAMPARDDEAWTKDPRYAKGHMLYVDLAKEDRATQSIPLAGKGEQFGRWSADKTRVMNKWRLAISLMRLPWLREFRVHDPHCDTMANLDRDIKVAKKRASKAKVRGKKAKDDGSDEEQKEGDPADSSLGTIDTINSSRDTVKTMNSSRDTIETVNQSSSFCLDNSEGEGQQAIVNNENGDDQGIEMEVLMDGAEQVHV